MDGKSLKRAVLDFLDEEVASSVFAKPRVIYEYLDAAAVEFARDTQSLTAEVGITTVAAQQEYDLPPDFICLYMKNAVGRFFGRYYDGSSHSWPVKTSYEKIFKSNLTDGKETPGRFAIRDKDTQDDLIQGTADAAGAATGGACILQDDSMLFTTANRVYARDRIHNVTDGSDGVVLAVTDATHLSCALFDGASNEWAIDDAYVIQPAAQKELILDAPSETSGHVLTVAYVCRPTPVYSDHGFWRIDPMSCRAIAAEAAFLYLQQKGDFVAALQLRRIYEEDLIRTRREKAMMRLQDGRYRQRS